MKMTVKADFPNLPKGEIIDIVGFGAVENGSSLVVDIDKEQQEAFEANPNLVLTKASSTDAKEDSDGG